jgi:GT2 family glycosyltransferase
MISVVISSRLASNLVPCIESVRCREPALRIIVVDDGLDLSEGDAKSKTECFLCDTDPALRVAGGKPFVYARNCNIGIRAAGDDDVILLNDDALLRTPNGFSQMQTITNIHEEWGIISATTNVVGNPAQQQHVGRGLRDEPRAVAFVCVLIPRRTIERVGLLDEDFTAYGWEDNDYCRRVRHAGLKIGIFDGCYVDHGSLQSTFRGDPRSAGDIRAGAEIYKSKWGDLA